MKNIKLIQNLPFASCPSLCDLDDDKHNIDWCCGPGGKCRLYIIGNTFGTICGVWADCDQDALDLAVDSNFLNSFMLEESEVEEEDEVTRLGNASEPFDISDMWIGVADSSAFDASFWYTLGAAKGNGSSTLYC